MKPPNSWNSCRAPRPGWNFWCAILLAYTQVTRLDAKLEETDANQTLAEALVNLGGAIAESGAAVTSDKLPVLRAHGTHLRQLFQNLIGNAIKYRSEDRTPTVHIGAERQDGYWVFTVRDNGIGIPPEFKEQIFGLFTRLHNADRYAGHRYRPGHLPAHR